MIQSLHISTCINTLNIICLHSCTRLARFSSISCWNSCPIFCTFRLASSSCLETVYKALQIGSINSLVIIFYGIISLIYRYRSFTSWLRAELTLFECEPLWWLPTPQSDGSRLRQRLFPPPPASTAHSLEAFEPPELSVVSMVEV